MGALFLSAVQGSLTVWLYRFNPDGLFAAGNVTAPGQVRSVFTFTQTASGTVSFYALMNTDLVVDVSGWFRG